MSSGLGLDIPSDLCVSSRSLPLNCSSGTSQEVACPVTSSGTRLSKKSCHSASAGTDSHWSHFCMSRVSAGKSIASRDGSAAVGEPFGWS